MQQPANLRTGVLLGLIAAIAVGSNAAKAVHIDDTAYLLIARAIRTDPLHAMSHELSWTRAREPVFAVNQPHLFFYVLAATTAVGGESDVAVHLVESLFTVAAMLLFYALARRFAPQQALLLTALLVLGPAVLPEQNVMCDVPMLTFWLLFLWALLTPRRGDGVAYPLLAALAAAAACLVKYTSLILLPVLAIDLCWRGEKRRLWLLLVPVSVLGLWSWFNYLDYGHIHLLGREAGNLDLELLLDRVLAYFICLGAVAPFAVLLVPYLLGTRSGLVLLLVGLADGAALTYWWSQLEKPFWVVALRAVFLANGVIVFGAALTAMREQVRHTGNRFGSEEARPFVVLGSWLLGSTAFIMLFAPFLAVRHVLPAIAAVLLLCSWHLKSGVGGTLRSGALGATVGLGLLLALSDWLLADVYRSLPARLATPQRIAAALGNPDEGATGTVWFVGHWGWQWYAERAGLHLYEPNESELRPGDWLVVPEMVPRQDIDKKDGQRLQRVGSIVVPSGWGTRLRTVTKTPLGGYYSVILGALPWTWSTTHLDEFTIYRIGPPSGVGTAQPRRAE